MIVRPKPNESEDELLRSQEEFTKNRSKKPAATLVKNPLKTERIERLPIQEVSVPVLSGIVEKNLDVKTFEFQVPKSHIASQASTSYGSSQTSNNLVTHGSVQASSNEPEISEERDVESLKREIHLENVSRLSKMSHEEIMHEREQLLSKIDPNLIEFFKQRKVDRAEKSKNETKMPVDDNKASTDKDALTPSLPLNEFPIQPTTQWPHMDEPEPEKMAWMGTLPDRKPKDLYSARFDFKGNLIPRDADIPVSSGLHHHGLEPEAPGYTMEELLRLCRSQVPSQRVLALNALSRIVALAKSGAFDEILLPPTLLKSLLENQICTIIRYALDETAESVVVAACSLLAALLHNELDETSLDIAYGLSFDTSQLTFVPLNMTKSEEEMDDEELCNADTIMGLLRMRILNRLRYILEVTLPRSGRCVANIFSIFIRIARHSEEACKQIMECPRLMQVIIDSFMPVEWRSGGCSATLFPFNGMPFSGALKLCRIIAGWNQELAFALVDTYKIGDSMIRYIITEPDEMMIPLREACQLVVESYRLWGQLLNHGLCRDYFSDTFETMTNHMRAAISVECVLDRRQFQLDRAAALALTIQRFFIYSDKSTSDGQLQLKGLLDIVIMALLKMIRTCETNAHVSYFYLIASFANCCANAINCRGISPDRSEIHTLRTEMIPKFQSCFGARFEKESIAPPRTTIHLLTRDPPGLPSLESIGGGSLIELVRNGSLYPMFSSLRRLSRAAQGSS